MSFFARRRLGSCLFPVALTVILLSSGCDSGINEPEAVTLTRDVSFRFEFGTEDVDGGKIAVIRSMDRVDLGDDLEGFSKDDIVSARVNTVELTRVQPPLLNLNALFREARFLVYLTEEQSAVVAESGSLPAEATGRLTAAPTVEIAEYAADRDFGAMLEVRAQDLPPDDYVVTAQVRLTLTLGGL